jgi:acyl-CoA dehydrogenase
MDFNIPEEIRLIQQTVSKFVQKELEPISRQVEEDAKIPDHIVEKMRDPGLFGLTVPEEYGGMGLSSLAEVIIYEKLNQRIGAENDGNRDCRRDENPRRTILRVAQRCPRI